MASLLKAFWPLSTPQLSTPTVPNYRQGELEDPLELQVRSLLYMFRRCNIPDSEAFISDAKVGGIGVAGAGGSDKYRLQAQVQQHLQKERNKQFATVSAKAGMKVMAGSLERKLSLSDLTIGNAGFSDDESEIIDSNLPGLSELDKGKLDALYNKSAFEKVLRKDEHRVLVDWKKNKFRALCILSGKPSETENILPRFPVKSYSFVILPPKSSEYTYITTLSESNLYIEHYISKETKRRFAKEALDLAKRTKTTTAQFSKNDRALVVNGYLSKLAVEVQVDRLYKTLYRERMKLEATPKSNVLQALPEKSTPRVAPSTPIKRLTVSTSPAINSYTPPKYYMKSKQDVEIPFSRRASPKAPQPQPAFVSVPQTTKPRIMPKAEPRSKNSSPTNTNIRSMDSGYGSPTPTPSLRKRASNVALSSTTNPVLKSPTRSISSSGSPNKPRTISRKGSNALLVSEIPRPVTRLSHISNNTSQETPSNNDKIRAEVMAQTRKAVKARLDRERLLIEAERRAQS